MAILTASRFFISVWTVSCTCTRPVFVDICAATWKAMPGFASRSMSAMACSTMAASNVTQAWPSEALSSLEKICIVNQRQRKQRFCEELMARYGKSGTVRPKSFFPRIDAITVYAITVERITGKEQALPPISEQWPAKDRTKTPEAQAP